VNEVFVNAKSSLALQFMNDGKVLKNIQLNFPQLLHNHDIAMGICHFGQT
jgi:hypothetical protein